MAHQQNAPRLLVRREATGHLFAVFSEDETAALRAAAGTILVQDLKKAISEQWGAMDCDGPFEWECVQVLATQAVAQEMGAIPLVPLAPEQIDPEDTAEADQSAAVFRHFCADIDRIHSVESLRGGRGPVGVSFGVRLFTPFISREQLGDACRIALQSMTPEADAAARQAMEEVESLRGPLRIWDVFGVAGLSYLFYADAFDRYPMECMTFLKAELFPAGFNPDLSGWKTAGVTSMAYMFCGCAKFAGTGLSGWDVGSVKTLERMFAGCHEFAEPLDCWSPLNCKSMHEYESGYSASASSDEDGTGSEEGEQESSAGIDAGAEN